MHITLDDISNLVDELHKSIDEETNKDTLEKNAEKVFVVNLRGKIIDPIYLSKHFGIRIRNINMHEILYIISQIHIHSSDDMIQTLEKRILNQIAKGHVSNRYVIEDIVKVYGEETLNFIYYILYLKDLIILEAENNDIVMDYIDGYYNLKNKSDDTWNQYYDAFIRNYITFLNTINFFSEEFTGISVKSLHIYSIDFDSLFLRDIPGHENLYLNFKNAKKIDDFLISEENKTNYMFISEWLGIGYDSTNYRLQNLSYFTLLEFMLTHNPDSYRYNVEDSISKQFINNIASCFSVSKKIKTIEQLNEFRNELRDLYDYRSSMLHGEFREIPKIFKKLNNLNFYEKRHKRNKRLGIDVYESDFHDTEYFISERLREIFNLIFNLYVEKPIFIESIKANKKTEKKQ